MVKKIKLKIKESEEQQIILRELKNIEIEIQKRINKNIDKIKDQLQPDLLRQITEYQEDPNESFYDYQENLNKKHLTINENREGSKARYNDTINSKMPTDYSPNLEPSQKVSID